MFKIFKAGGGGVWHILWKTELLWVPQRNCKNSLPATQPALSWMLQGIFVYWGTMQFKGKVSRYEIYRWFDQILMYTVHWRVTLRKNHFCHSFHVYMHKTWYFWIAIGYPFANWKWHCRWIFRSSVKCYRVLDSVADPHLLLCRSGSRIQKMSIWIRILGGKD